MNSCAEKLREKYREIYRQLLKIDSSCVSPTNENNLPIKTLLDQIVVDVAEMPQALSYFQENKVSVEDLRIRDMSGIGLYTFAYQLANAWAAKKLFSHFTLVIVVPIEQMYRISGLSGLCPRDLLKVWDIDLNSELEYSKTLVIISGWSAKPRDYGLRDCPKPKDWFNLVLKDFPNRIIISSSHDSGSNSITLSLKPFVLRVEHLNGEKRKGPPKNGLVNSSTCDISGKTIIQEAQKVIIETFYEMSKGKEETSMKAVIDWHSHIKHCLRVEEYEIGLKQLFKPVSIREYIQILINDPQPNTLIYPNSIKKPYEWFGAAVTFSSENASYCISNCFITRKKNNYIGNLGPVPEVVQKYLKGSDSIEEKVLKIDEKMCEVLKIVLSFQFNEKVIAEEIKRVKWKKFQDSFSKSEQKKFQNDLKGITHPTSLLLALAPGLPYEEIQRHFLKEIEAHNASFITNCAVDILSGTTDHSGHFGSFILGISAIFLGEAARYPVSFISTLCLLDIARWNGSLGRNLWINIFGHSDYSDPTQHQSVNESILFDVIRMLGGLHPMTQANSFNQVCDEDQPKFGMHFVDFKIQLILLKWLSILIEMEEEVVPNLSCEVVVSNDLTGVVGDLSEYFLAGNGPLNPHIFDRFTRRLESFNFMLVRQVPLREQFPKDIWKLDASGMNHQITAFIQNHRNSLRRSSPFNKVDQSTMSEAERVTLRRNGITTSCFSLIERMEFSFHQESGLLQVLAIDPYFHEMRFFLAESISTRKVSNETEHLERCSEGLFHVDYILDAIPNRGSFYYITLNLKIKYLYFIRNEVKNQNSARLGKNLKRLINLYLSNHEDIVNPDYWRVFGMRAIIRLEKGIDDEQVLNDFIAFLFHTEVETNSIYNQAQSHMKSKLKDLLCNAKNQDFDYFIKVATIFRCLRNYKLMLKNLYSGVKIAVLKEDQTLNKDKILKVLNDFPKINIQSSVERLFDSVKADVSFEEEYLNFEDDFTK